MTTCALYADPQAPGPLCGEPAVIVLRTACVHEHVAERPACADHEAEVKGRSTPRYCTPCRAGAPPHTCPVLLEWLPLEVRA